MAADSLEPVTLNKAEASLARESSRRLAPYLKGKRKLRPRIIVDESGGEPVVIPYTVFQLVVSVLNQMAEGNAVSVVALPAELTTQEAADLLNVSRPYLVRLLDEGAMPHRKVGKHRRVLLRHLLEYKRKAFKHQLAALDELTEQGQELNMGY